MTAAGAGESKVVRGVAVVLVCGGFLGLSLWLGRRVALGRRHGPGLGRNLGPGDGHAVRLNSVTAEARTCRSPLPPDRIVERYVEAAMRDAGARNGDSPFVQRLPDGRRFVRYRDRDGQYVTVIVGPASGGGSVYTVSRGEAGSLSQGRGRDCAGLDPPDVPRPPDSWRAFCLENPVGSGQSMLLYHGYNAPEATRRFYLRRMPELGWRLNEKMAEHLGDAALHTDLKLPADYLAFKKGRRTCIINMARRPSGAIATTILVR